MGIGPGRKVCVSADEVVNGPLGWIGEWNGPAFCMILDATSHPWPHQSQAANRVFIGGDGKNMNKAGNRE